MMHNLIKIVLLLILLPIFTNGQDRAMNKIEGYAPDYVGKSVTVYEIDDYLTKMETKIAETKVKADSTFEVVFFNDTVQKIKIKFNKDFLYMYLDPGQSYDLAIQSPRGSEAKTSLGSDVNYVFGGLDSIDINYKIIVLENQIIQFLDKYYNHRNRTSEVFVSKLDTFKLELEKEYAKETSPFFKDYIRYAVASLDDLYFLGNRNRYEKYDFYLKNNSVLYQNDRYMEYVLKYYNKYVSQMSTAANDAFYKGVVRSSPTVLMKTLSKDYALENIRLREFVLLKMLSDIYKQPAYPQTNIETILDSLSNHALFKAHRPIAKNLLFRLKELQPGSPMPDFVLKTNKRKLNKADLNGKHTYIHFMEEGKSMSENDYDLLKRLYKKYSAYINFLTVVISDDEALLSDPTPYIKKHNIPWEIAIVSESETILKRLNIQVKPHYTFIDSYGYVIASPALSPRPNNEYESIERSMHGVMKIREAEKNNERNRK